MRTPYLLKMSSFPHLFPLEDKKLSSVPVRTVVSSVPVFTCSKGYAEDNYMDYIKDREEEEKEKRNLRIEKMYRQLHCPAHNDLKVNPPNILKSFHLHTIYLNPN